MTAIDILHKALHDLQHDRLASLYWFPIAVVSDAIWHLENEGAERIFESVLDSSDWFVVD